MTYSRGKRRACLECRESPTGVCRRHRAPEDPSIYPPEPNVFGGQYFGRDDAGRMHMLGPTAPAGYGEPDAWVCRRLADFPRGELPAGGAVAECSKCAAVIVFNPARQVTAEKVCMQCASIVPLPIETPN